MERGEVLVAAEYDAGLLALNQIRRESRYAVASAFGAVLHEIGLRVAVGVLVDEFGHVEAASPASSINTSIRAVGRASANVASRMRRRNRFAATGF